MSEPRKKIPASVMIVEDEKDLCYLLEIIIKRQNLTTTCANSLFEARQLINTTKPSVLFVDNHLPDGSGADFIEQVRLLYPSIKIIMMTAYDTPVDREKAFRNGADYFISKPFSAVTINNVLSRVKQNAIG